VQGLLAASGSRKLLRPKHEKLLNLLRITVSRQGSMDLLKPLIEAGLNQTGQYKKIGTIHSGLNLRDESLEKFANLPISKRYRYYDIILPPLM
jgi:hypothetical protein